jgi:large subunit ribosomal protein L19
MDSKIQAFEQKYQRKVPTFEVGDVVAVHTIIREGERKRIQIYKGLVIAKNGKGASKTFTVRKISYGVGVEKIFPLYSTNVEKIELIKKGNVRRAKLYYLRDRVGKAALKVRAGGPVMVVVDAAVEELATETAEAEVTPEVVEVAAETSTEESV